MQTLIVLGATGDLAERLLLPGLGGLIAAGHSEELLLIGSDREDWDEERWRARVEGVTERTRYIRADATDPSDLRRLLDAREGTLAIYFALPPAITERACRGLAEIGVPGDTRLIMEKPFGVDAAGAAALNELLADLVPEERVFRVDHFLGMSTVLNILGVRFANRIVEPVLSAEHVEAVDVVFDETLGLEGRAGYYDSAGALVDMIQSHLLQVMSLVAMEPPPTLDAVDLRDARAQVLRATRVWDDDPVASSFRARYGAGEVDGRRLPSYADEEGVDAARGTETLAEVVLAVDTWRWSGVPFRLRAGKAIGSPRKEAAVGFRPARHVPHGLTGPGRPNRLRMGINPGGGRLLLEFNVSGPGDPFEIDPVSFEADFGPGELPEYGEVLKGALEGDPTLFVRGDMAVRSWEILEPVQRAWRKDEVPLEEYPAGSAGPEGWPL